MTYATDAGLVIGKKYKLKLDSDYYEDRTKDMIFTFTHDDQSTCVRFDCPTAYDLDGWTYIAVNAVVEATAEEVAEPVAATFAVTVGTTNTAINIGKALTAAQVAAVLVAAGL